MQHDIKELDNGSLLLIVFEKKLVFLIKILFIDDNVGSLYLCSGLAVLLHFNFQSNRR
jgi:hypothetical protein